MLQARFDTDFAQEPVGPDRQGELGPQHLDRHVSVVLPVVGEVHMGHASGPDLATELVTVRQGGPQAIKLVHRGGTHVRPRSGAKKLPLPGLIYRWSVLL